MSGLAFIRFHPQPKASWVPTNLGNQTCGSTRCFRQDASQPWSLQVATTRAQSFRFETRLGDFAPGETDRTRSELQFDRKYDPGVDIWLAWQLRWSVTPAVVSNSLILGQLHQSEDAGDAAGYPPFEFEIGPDGKLYIYTSTVAQASQPSFYPRTLRAGPIDLPQNVLHDIVVRVRMDWTGNALLYVWINKVQVVGIENISIGMNDQVGTYLKLGLYSRPETSNQTAVAEYWGVTEGYDSLMYRVI